MDLGPGGGSDLLPTEGHVAAALSDEYERRILAVCVAQPKSVKEIERETQLPPATLYRHVNRLLRGGLLFIERSALTEDGKRYDLYRCGIRRARLEFDADGIRCTWEPVEGAAQKLARVWSSLRTKPPADEPLGTGTSSPSRKRTQAEGREQ